MRLGIEQYCMNCKKEISTAEARMFHNHSTICGGIGTLDLLDLL